MTEPYTNDENVGEIWHVDIIETHQNQKPESGRAVAG
jgi:hypothetical protein